MYEDTGGGGSSREAEEENPLVTGGAPKGFALGGVGTVGGLPKGFGAAC